MKLRIALIFSVLIKSFYTFNSSFYEEINLNNIEEKLNSNKFTFVIFYTNYDKISKKYSFLYDKIAKLFLVFTASDKINLYKLNVYDNIAIQSIYNLKSFPKFFLFFQSNNRYLEYVKRDSSSKYNENEIVEWLSENTMTKTIEINIDEVNELKENGSLLSIFYGKKISENFKIYEFLSRKLC